MKKHLSLAISVAVMCLFSGYAAICSAQPPVAGGYKPASVKNADVVAAANFAVESRKDESKSATLKLDAILKAETQIVQGTNYLLSLRVSEGGKLGDVQATVYRDLQQQFTLTNWESKSSIGSVAVVPIKPFDKAAFQAALLSGTWEYGGDINKFVANGKVIQRVITVKAEASKEFEFQNGEIDFVGVIDDNMLKGTQVFYSGVKMRSECPGLSSTKINADLTLSADGKTITVMRDDPVLLYATCQWTNENRPRVQETMNKQP